MPPHNSLIKLHLSFDRSSKCEVSRRRALLCGPRGDICCATTTWKRLYFLQRRRQQNERSRCQVFRHCNWTHADDVGDPPTSKWRPSMGPCSLPPLPPRTIDPREKKKQHPKQTSSGRMEYYSCWKRPGRSSLSFNDTGFEDATGNPCGVASGTRICLARALRLPTAIVPQRQLKLAQRVDRDKKGEKVPDLPFLTAYRPDRLPMEGHLWASSSYGRQRCQEPLDGEPFGAREGVSDEVIRDESFGHPAQSEDGVTKSVGAQSRSWERE